MKTVRYEYENLPIPGGGYVTGYVFDEGEKDVLYARTDIGGMYRFDYQTKRWVSLTDHVTMDDLSETFPSAAAVDKRKPGSLYVACGVNTPDAHSQTGVFAVSVDYGKHFIYYRIPALVHGNLNGRGSGYRLVVDYSRENSLYYASGSDGLLRTRDGGQNWEKLDVCGEKYMTFIWVSENGETLVCGTAGVTNATALLDEECYEDNYGVQVTKRRGQGLYVSYDGGSHFAAMPQPDITEYKKSRMPGLVPERYAYDGTYLYVTMAETGRWSYVVERGYSCDSGDTLEGCVLRYTFDETEKIAAYTDITPTQGCRDFGYSGICTHPQEPGLVVCTTICHENCEDGVYGDCIFLSRDYGKTWKKILQDLTTGNIAFRAPYMRPQCNGGHSIVHWMSDIKINPFRANEAWINTGTGAFRTENLLADEPSFTDWCDGIEETVHLNVYSLPVEETRVVDILGDLGGFLFTDLQSPCDNSFADSEGNRYITCINADFSDTDPNRILVMPRGNWTGKTKGGLILSTDGGKTFKRLAMPFGISEGMDEKLRNIEHPNVNAGWCAMSPNGQNMVWCVADNIELPVDSVLVSQDGGTSFQEAEFYDCNQKRQKNGLMKVFSDRVNSQLFYGFSDQSEFYVSSDGGKQFRQYGVTEAFPKVQFGLIDCADHTEVRGEAGKSGVFYMALGQEGIWKMHYDQETDEITLKKLTEDGVTVYRLGLGVGRPGGSYCRENKALYLCGRIQDTYGFYRSLDDGARFEPINTDQQRCGEINSIDGDCHTFGRFYLATGSRGILYGDSVE